MSKMTPSEGFFRGIPLRQVFSGALPGIRHHFDHWFFMRYVPLEQEEASLQPEPIYNALDLLYQEVVREVRQALAAFRNPWIPAPRCLCVAMANDILYKETRHQVWIHKKEQYFLQLVDLYTFGVAAMLASAAETDADKTATLAQQVQSLLGDVEHLKARYREVTFNHLQGFEQELTRYELALQEALLRWQGNSPLDEVKAYHDLFSQLRALLWERIRQLLIHELMHAWARRKRRYGGKDWGWYSQTGVERFDSTYARAQAARSGRLFLHWAMNEAITDWIMLRISGGSSLLSWQNAIFPLGYSHWLINDIIATLDTLWDRVSAAVPAFPRKRIHTAQDLLYAIYFQDPEMSTLLQQGLAVATGDLQAFTLLSLACERFTLGNGAQTTAGEAQLRQSLADVQRLLGPILPMSERMVPFPFWLQMVLPGERGQLARVQDTQGEGMLALPY